MGCSIETNSRSIQGLTHAEFAKLRECIQQKLGIKMPESKKAVLEARLQKRLRITRKKCFSEYCDFLFSEEGTSERIDFIDAVTTHKTFFFREAEQIEYLCTVSLSKLYPEGYQSSGEFLDIWSAGCSSGEEAYSIAICLEEFKEQNPDFCLDYSILATDVSLRAVEKARSAIYSFEELDGVSDIRIGKYFLRSKDPSIRVKKVIPEIRQHLRSGVLNLNSNFRFDQKLDVIFCRNVMIYFDGRTKEKVVRRFADNLREGGYLFIGSSESLRDIDDRLKQAAPSVYQRI